MLAELIFDFLPWPTRSGGLSDRIAERLDSGSFRPEVPGSIKRALNESGCLDEEVIAAGELMQGVEPSLVSMVTGLALIELARPRRSKSLPRNFVLAVTADRVVAFKASGGADGETGGPYLLSIRPEEHHSWPRESVRLVDLSRGAASTGGTLVLEGIERVPVWRTNSPQPDTDELLELLGT
jgi:hypothetical protein